MCTQNEKCTFAQNVYNYRKGDNRFVCSCIYYNLFKILYTFFNKIFVTYLHRNWWILFGIIIILTAGTRFYKVTEPQHVW